MARRSTGCRACVRRRIRCDERRPSCRRCGIAGIKCDGPPPARLFTNETQESLAWLAQPRPRRSSPQASSQRSSTGPSGTLEANVGSSLFVEDVCRNFFLDKYFATSGPDGDWSANKAWMATSLLHPDEYPTSALALRCLSASYFGRIHFQGSIKKDALQLYGKALVALSDNLKDPKKALNFDTMAATSVLNLYECVNFTSQKGWIHHCQGAARLLQLRGPGGFREQPDKAVFAMTRIFLVCEALAAPKRTFLEREEWLSILTPADEDLVMIEELNSIFTRLPGLAEDVESLQGKIQDSAGRAERVARTKEDLLSVLRALEAWHVRWEEQPHRLPKVSPERGGAGLLPDTEPPLLHNIFTYSALDFATANCHWNTYMIVTLKWLRKLSKLEITECPPSDTLSELPDMMPYIWNICRSIDYHLLPRHIYQGSHYVLFAARIAFKRLSPYSRLAQWLAKVLDMIALKNGFGLANDVLTNASVLRECHGRVELVPTFKVWVTSRTEPLVGI